MPESPLLNTLVQLVRWIRYVHRRAVTLLVYGAITAAAYLLAHILRFDLAWPSGYEGTFAASLTILLGIRLTCNRLFQLSTHRWRYVGPSDVWRLGIAVVVGSTCFWAVLQLVRLSPPVPLPVVLADAILHTFITASIWMLYRTAFEWLQHHRSGSSMPDKRVLIVGAGEAGYMLARQMSRSLAGYRPVGFVDDNSHKWGTRLGGVEVIGSIADLPAIAKAERVEEIVISIPAASPPQMRRIVDLCEQSGLPFKILPGVAEVLAGNVLLTQLREVHIEDLLGREPIQLELPELAEDLRDRCVLITGAAGSIGSELSRQVALHGPRLLLLFDQAETELFYLQLELKERHPGLKIAAIVGDVVDAGAVERVFRAHAPDRVFHAAAYKHVPMMEASLREAVRNNVVGTRLVADAAGRHGAGRFVLVSTDKAVRPTSIMGATKRLAEIAVLELQGQYPTTAFAAVRFGNVLGSNGSVIPIFKRQIAAGKPLTVTHPEMTRYFMTIPEASQLILQASLLPASRGHVVMLEMGDPVRIVDLAKNLLRLSATSGNGSPRLVFTGLRPGEKLHEELIAPDENTVATAIPKVRVVKTSPAFDTPVSEYLAEWERALDESRDRAVLDALVRLFPNLAAGKVASEGSASAQARRAETALAGSKATTGPG